MKKLKEKVSDIVHQEDKTKQAKLKLVLLIMAPLMLVTDVGVEIPGMLVMILIY